ncbi:uncharacterized protein [Nicotiana tomentosiformis]|uniref:uncharacterized protein n=1 Tax=Nicotiana tomentosiformis TaxID=4098 RepID=UPI00388C56A0
MSEPSEMNFEKMRKMDGVKFEGTTDPTISEQWLERMERVFEQLECTNVAKFKHSISLLQKDAYDWWVSVPNAKAKPPRINKNFSGFLVMLEVLLMMKETSAEDLNGSNQKSVAILQLEDFSKLVSAALTWERIDKEEASRRENKFRKGNSDYGGPYKKGKFDYSKTESAQKSSYHKQNKPNFSTYSTPNYGQGKTYTPTCAQCGKNHYGAYRRASSACFNCGSQDHKVKDCPNPDPLSSTHTEGSVQKPITTHSQANSGARPRNIQEAGSGGVNQVQGERSLTSNIISVVLARKMIHQGCDAYLAHIVDTRLGSPCLEDIPTMCDFPYVFPDNLLGFPPEREIEFPIELVPGTTPISIAPYRMAPAELKELKGQLQELLEKGFICLSISPWGARVLIVKKKDDTFRLCIDY